MKSTNLVIALIAAFAIAAASSAKPMKGKAAPLSPEDRQAMAIEAIAAYDSNTDQALDAVELEQAIQGMYAKRNSAIRSRQIEREKNGLAPEGESSNGLVTMYPIAEDAAALLLEDHDTNGSGDLDASELIGSMKTIGKLSVVPRYRPIGNTLKQAAADQQS